MSIEHYEGLVFSTARRVVNASEFSDLDDIRQELRIKVWRALESYDPTRCRTSVENYVYGCVVNGATDIMRKRRTGELHIEDIAPEDFVTAVERRALPRDYFEGRYLSEAAERVFARVEDEGVTVPSTLTERERAVLLYLYFNWREPNASEAGRELGLTRSQVETAVAGIREKMADWRPSTADVVPLPHRGRPPVAAAA